MNEHRVVVTGIGIVSPIGLGVKTFWKALLDGEIAVDAITRFDASEFPSRVAAQVDDFDPADYIDARTLRRTERFAQFSIAASRMALDDAAFSVNGNGNDVGVYLGSALGGLAFAESQHDVFREKGLAGVRPVLAISVFGGTSTCNVALAFGLRGPNVANGNSCAAGSVAIGDAFRGIARGDMRAALAGGVEAPLSPLVYGAFAVIRAMSTRNGEPQRASRPFDRDRDGFVMAEGAAVLLLERLDDAVARNARIYGEIVGYGLTGDAHHMSAPRPDASSATRAMQGALREANIAPGEVELIDAHGSSTTLNDSTEALAYAGVFGEDVRVPVTATKGQHGHALGATGAWEAAISLLALSDGRVPGIANLEHPDPECPLTFVRQTQRITPRIALSNTSGFGGINAALVFKHVAQ